MADRSFKDYVAARFYRELYEAVKDHIETDFEKPDPNAEDPGVTDGAELSDIRVRKVRAGGLPGTSMTFDVVLEAEIEVSETGGCDGRESACSDFTVSCDGDTGKEFSDFKIRSVEQGDKTRKFSNPLSDSLVPVLSKDMLDTAAEDFLDRNHKKGLTSSTGVDALELIEEMGLKLEYRRLSKDGSVLGLTCFADCYLEVFDDSGNPITELFTEKTVIIDPYADKHKTPGALNNTLVHECIHWDKDRRAFLLKKLYNSETLYIKCLAEDDSRNAGDRTATDWMEWQTKAMTPRVQMLFQIFKDKAEELIGRYKDENHTYGLTDILEPVIESLAENFGVSIQAAKIRMIEAGYHEAEGVFNYVDGKYLRPYKFKQGALARNQTFDIGLEDALLIECSDPDLKKQISGGAYVYVDGHFCLNSPDYITRAEDGSVIMTDHARLNLDECCLAFDRKTEEKCGYANKDSVLFRDYNSGISINVSFDPGPNGKVMNRADVILKEKSEIRRTLHRLDLLPFNDCLKELMTWKEITVERLAEESLLNEKMIQRMRTERNYPRNVDCVVAVSVAMHLPPEISFFLIDKAGFSLRTDDNDVHVLYAFFLESYYMNSVRKCNEILADKGFPPMADDGM